MGGGRTLTCRLLWAIFSLRIPFKTEQGLSRCLTDEVHKRFRVEGFSCVKSGWGVVLRNASSLAVSSSFSAIDAHGTLSVGKHKPHTANYHLRSKCKDLWGTNMTTNRPLHFRPDWQISI